ncbi:MAG: hypothetical protein JNG84_00195, partial [Archangium sp.]|nr:hypothetical protein [Archangium sp.]
MALLDVPSTRLDPAALKRTAERHLHRIEAEVPDAGGLIEVSRLVLDAVERADGLTRRLRRLFTPHRLPVAFLALALTGVVAWVWLSFFHTATLTVAVPERDAREVKARLVGNRRLTFDAVTVPGSRESLAQVSAGQVDIAFVQGGFALPPSLLRREVKSHEVALLLVRQGRAFPSDVHTLVTSSEGEGSHTVLTQFLPLWHLESVALRFTWSEVVKGSPPPDDIDAVFAVKDASDDDTLRALATLHAAGFVLQPLSLGARAARFDFVEPFTVPSGYFEEGVPTTPIETLAVKTYIVAREGLTPRRLAQAAALADDDGNALSDAAVLPSTEMTSEVLQGVDAFVGLLVNIALAFLGLLGLDALSWRKPFHELNSLVSRLSLLQSQTDVLGVDEVEQRRRNRLVLSFVSDQLGLISTLASFYTQENSALLFDSISEIIHERCSALKINIQLKILQ